MAGFFDVIKSSQYFLRFYGVASITCLKISNFCGEFIIKIIIDSAEFRSESSINFRKTCGKFIGDFSINFRGKFTEDVFDFRCIIFSRSLTILVTRAESSSEIFCLRFDHMVAIPINNTGPMNKKNSC